MLVNDGSRREFSPVTAPFRPPIDDYAVETEIQRPKTSDYFGIFARRVQNGGYAFGADYYDRLQVQRLGSSGSRRSDLMENNNYKIDNDWRTYRVEVKGNTLRLLVNGGQVLEASDNQYLSAGETGLYVQGAQVNVRSFKIIAL